MPGAREDMMMCEMLSSLNKLEKQMREEKAICIPRDINKHVIQITAGKE